MHMKLEDKLVGECWKLEKIFIEFKKSFEYLEHFETHKIGYSSPTYRVFCP